MKSKAKVRAINKENYKLDYLLLILLTLFIVFSQLFGGLYFRSSFIPGIICMGLIFILTAVLIYKKKYYSKINNLSVMGLIGLFIAYILSFFVSLSPMEALDSAFKQFSILTTFITAFYISARIKDKDIFEYGIILMGFTLSIISLLNAAGVMNTNGVISKAERLGGVYQYPNTNAIIMGAVMLFLLCQLLDCKSIYKRLTVISVLYLSSWAFWASESRGALITILFLWMLNILFVGHSHRLQFLLYGGFFLGAGAILYTLYGISNKSINHIYFCIIIFAGIFVFTWISALLDKEISKIKPKIINLMVLTLFTAALALIIISVSLTKPLQITSNDIPKVYSTYKIKPSANYYLELEVSGNAHEQAELLVSVSSIDDKNNITDLVSESIFDDVNTRKISFATIASTRNINISFTKKGGNQSLKLHRCAIVEWESAKVTEVIKLDFVLLPDSIAKRVRSMSLSSGTFAERIVFMKDALKVLKDHLLLGTGGGGWRYSYTKYQSYGYISAQVHNHYLQTAVETGLIGILAMLVVFLGIFVPVFRHIFVYKVYNNRQLSLLALCLALLLHSALDFNFSIQGVALLFWAVLGMLLGELMDKNTNINERKYDKYLFSGIAITNICIIISTFIIYSGISYTSMGDELADDKPILAKNYYKAAMSRDFYNTEPIIKYAEMLALEADSIQSKEALEKSKLYYEKALSMEPNKINNYQYMLDFYMMHGFYKEASELVDRLISIQPLSASNYELKTEVNLHIYEAYIEQKSNLEAEHYKAKILEVEEQYNKLRQRKNIGFKLTDRTLDNLAQIRSR